MDRQGITVAGNIIVDTVKRVPSFPKPGRLVNILGASRGPGGIVPNVLIDLARMGSDIPLTACGCVGNDETGRYVTERMRSEGIDTEFVSVLDTATSYTDVMQAEDTGERTFFTYGGANDLFSPAHIPLEKIQSRMLHIGYLLLLKVFDGDDPEYGTVMARLLHDAKEAGLITSIDCVSNEQGRFSRVVAPALRYCDCIVVNEIEGCGAWGIPPRDESGKLLEENIVKALSLLLEGGVSRAAVIHCPEAGFMMDKCGRLTRVPSLSLPAGYIKGSVGAGDAFCAGCLRGFYKGWSAEKTLSFAAASAAANLSEPDATSGMRSEEEIFSLIDKYGFN